MLHLYFFSWNSPPTDDHSERPPSGDKLANWKNSSFTHMRNPRPPAGNLAMVGNTTSDKLATVGKTHAVGMVEPWRVLEAA